MKKNNKIKMDNKNFYMTVFLMFLTLILNVNAEVFIGNELKYSIVDSGSYINMVVYNASGVVEKKTVDKMSLSGAMGYEVIKNKVEFEVNNVKDGDIIADVKGLKYIKYDMIFVSNCVNCSLINDNGLIKVHFLTEKELNDNENIFIDSKSYVISIPSLNNSFYNTSLPSFSFTVINDSVSYSCNLIIDGVYSGVNETVLNNTLTTIISNTSLNDGVHYFNVECVNDTINDTSTTYYFTVDTVYLILTKNLINPLNNTYVNQNYSFINFTIQDINFNYLVYRFNNKTLNTSNLVLGMNFDNNSNLGESNSLAYDFSGNGNNGTISGAVYAAGKYGNALSFGGSSYVSVPNSSSLNTLENSSVTFEAWVKPEASDLIGYSLIFGRDYAGMRAFLFGLHDGKLYANLGVYDTTSSYIVLTAGVWQHVVLTWDDPNDIEKIYINGSIDLIGGGPFAEPWHVGYSNRDLWVGGREYEGSPVFFNGTIDEVRIYNRTLTADEVLLSYYSNFHANNFSSYDFISNYSTVSGRTVYNLSVYDKANNLNFSGDYNIFLNVENYLYPCNYSDYEDIVNSLTGQLNTCNSNLGTCNNSLIECQGNLSSCLNNSSNCSEYQSNLTACNLNLSLYHNYTNYYNQSFVNCSNDYIILNESYVDLNISFNECESNLTDCLTNCNNTNYTMYLECESNLSICNINLTEYASNYSVCLTDLGDCMLNLSGCNATVYFNEGNLGTDLIAYFIVGFLLFIILLLILRIIKKVSGK